MPMNDLLSEQDADAAVETFFNQGPPASPDKLRKSVVTALDTNPDEQAAAKRLANQTGLPTPAVLENKAQVEKQAKIDSFDFRSFAQTNPTTSALLSDEEFAKLAVDDIDNMGAIETVFSKFSNALTAAGVGLGPRFNAGMLGILETDAALEKQLGFSNLGLLAPVSPMTRSVMARELGPAEQRQATYRAARQSEERRADEIMAPILGDSGDVERAVYSGMTSLGQQLPGLVTAVITRNPEFALFGAGAITLGTSAPEGLDQGLSPVQALGYGLRDAYVEMGTEFVPVTKFLGDLKAGSGLLKTLLHQTVSEVPGEQLATVLQNLNEWATLNPEQPFSSYLEQLPGDMRDTLVATLTATGAQTTTLHITNRAVERVAARSRRAQLSEEAHKTLEQIRQLSTASKVLERDPESFETFIAKSTEGSPVEDVFIDPKELQQSGIDINALAELSPSVARQAATALQTGSLLRIPTSEYAAKIANTELGQPLLEVLKTDPLGMSRSEAQNFMQTQAAELEQEVERHLKDTLASDQALQSRSAVEQNILGQLKTANRFTEDVNGLYAKLMSNFYHVVGQRTGMTAEQMFERFPVSVQAEGALPTDLSQGVTKPPVDKEGNVVLDHWSNERGLTLADPKKWGKAGTFLPRDERNRIGVAPGRTYYGIASGQEGGYKRESGLGPVRYQARVPAARMYDMAADPENLKARGRELMAQGATQLDGKSLYEHLIQDAGYAGYWVNGPSGLTAAVFEPLALDPYTADREDLQPGNVKNLLQKRNWSILTAENPNAQALTPEENKQRNNELVAYLQQQGIDFEPTVGQYGNKENSFFLFGVTAEQAHEIGNMFGQQSVLVPQGLLYSDMTLERAIGITEHDINKLPEDFYTIVPSTNAAFTVDIDFEQRVPFGEFAQTMKQTDTPEFRTWFGNSKVVDENGEPLVVYHGTNQTFTTFDRRRAGAATGDPNSVLGVFFTSSPEAAKAYGNNVVNSFIRLEKPFTEMSEDELIGLEKEDYREMRRDLIEDGYDGIIVDVVDLDTGEETGEKWFVVFNPNQIKSAIGNRGTFDPNDPNILYQNGPAAPFRDPLGFYSAVEKEVLNMRITGWEPSKKPLMTDDQREELKQLRSSVFSTKDPKYARLLELNAIERREKGVAKGSELWAKIQKLPVKKEELQWLGLEEYLKSQTDFTRDEVTDFIQQNGVQVEEIIADQEASDKLGDWSDYAAVDDPDYIQSEKEYYLDEAKPGGNYEDEYFDQVDKVVRKNKDDISRAIENYDTKDPDWTRKAREYAEENYKDDIEEQLDAWAYDRAYETYWDNPIREATNSNGDVIRGNDDYGYSLNGEFLEAYSTNEAQVRAAEKLGDSGDFVTEDDPRAKKWEQYVTSGSYLNYRERKLTLPGVEGDFYNNTHFEDRNIVAFTRETDRTLYGPAGLTEEDKTVIANLEKLLAEDFSKEREDALFASSLAAVKESYALAGVPFDPDLGQNYRYWASSVTDILSPVEQAAMAKSKEAGGMNGTYEAATAITNARRDLYARAYQYREFLQNKNNLERDLEKAKNPAPKRNVKTFFVDEFQSDWHQHGRQQGYATGADAGELEQLAQEKIALAENKSAEIFARYQNGPIFDEATENGVAAIEALLQVRNAVIDGLRDAQLAGHNNTEALRGEVIRWSERKSLYSVLKVVRDYAKEPEGAKNNLAFPYMPDAAALKKLLTDFSRGVEGGADILRLLDEADAGIDQAEAERYGVADAPFKGDAWIALGMKRAILSAVEDGYSRFAWADAEVLVDRWSERYRTLYETQYDTKMPSIAKRILGVAPTHIEADKALEGSGYWYVDLTPELVSKIKSEGMALFQRQRGSFNPQTSMITLLNAADLSTFLHESGHFFLETLNKLAQNPNAPAQIKRDMDTVLKWMGAKDLAEWNTRTLEQQREGHEKFARGFEAYLFEGRAPNPELRSIFARFRDWLVNLYRELRNLNVDLNDDVRKVFDRMMATDEMIRETEILNGLTPMFATAEEAQMSQEEWEAYQTLGQEATETAKNNLESRSLRDMKWLSNAKSQKVKQLQREAEGKRKAVRREVTDEIMAEPVNQARQFIRRGMLPNGTKAEGAHRIDIDTLKQTYGEGPDALWRQLESKFGKYGVLGQNGVHPDALAEQFGFSSGDEMLKALAAAENPKDRIDALADQRMLERYGDITNPQALERAAESAIHNDARTRFVASELNALQKATGKRKILNQAAKQFAETLIARLRVRDLRPSRYTAAEAKAAKAALDALKKGDLDTAAAEKRNQLVQLQAAKAALNAQEEVEKAITYLNKFNREGTRKNIDPTYRDQIDQLLERFDLKPASLKAIDKRKSLVDWVAALGEEGIEPDIPQEILDAANRKHFKDMTVEEVRGLVDTVRQIEHLGRLKTKLLTAKDQRDFDTTVSALVVSIEENSKGRTADNVTRPTAADQMKRLYKGYLAQHRKIASLARQMDGVKDGGRMWEVFIRSMNEAGNREASMREEATVKLAQLVLPLMKQGKMGGKGVYIRELGRSFNREERIALLLNLGNEGNKQRLLDGENWTEEQIQPVLDLITPKEAQFAQSVWDLFESYRPQIAAKEKRIYGKEPEWVEPMPLTVAGQELRGGYFPIKYDTRRNAAAEQHDMAEVAKQQMRGAYTSATTRRSFVKSRADEVKGRPLLLSTDALYTGMNEVIHDLSWHEWLIDANRLMRSKKLDTAIRNIYGAEIVQQMKETIKDIAAGEMPSGGSFEKVMANLRAGAVVTGLGLSVATAIINTTGLAQSVVRVGPRWVLQGLDAWAHRPVDLVTEIYGKSEFMRLRGKTMQREINEIQSMIRDKSKARQVIDKLSFMPVTYTQLIVDTPTWWGAYQKALAEGNTEDRAVALADQAVLDAQGGGQVKDLSGIQRGGPIMKLFTTFYGYFATTWQLTVEQTSKTDFRNPLDVMRLAGDYFMLYILPAAFGTLIRGLLSGEDDWDDPEKLAERYVNEQISFAFGTLVGVREMSSAVQKAVGVNQYDFAYGGPAGLRFFNEIDRLGQQIGQGELDRALLRSVVNVAGVALRLPGSQINRTLDGAVAIMEGDTKNPLSLVFGPPKN